MRRKDWGKLHLVEIEWNDASGGHESWAPLEDIAGCDPDYRVLTVGYLVNRTDKFLRVVQNVSQHGQAGHSMTIPRKYVRRMRRLA